jgi:hypothetical protein
MFAPFDRDNTTKTYPASLVVKLQNGDSTIIGLSGTASAPADVRSGSTVPQEYALSQNYPNPFNTATEISYSIPQRADVTLTVYDELGRSVEQLVSGTRDAGVYNVTFNSNELPAGVYYYELRVNNFVQNKLMQIVK